MKPKNRTLPFYQVIPKLLTFQLVSFLILSILTWVISALCSLLLGLAGKAAVTSGDLSFLFTHWQGYVIILLTLIMVISYVAIELNAMIYYCSQCLDGEKPSVWSSIIGGFKALKRYLNPRGLAFILFTSVITPILGFGFSVSLTESFYIPRFIMSVINSTPLFRIGYAVVIAILAVIAVVYSFILHGVMLDGMTLKEAGSNSRRMIKSHMKNFLFEILRFIVLGLIAVILSAFIAMIPLLIVQLIPMSETATRFCNIFFCNFIISVILTATVIAVSSLTIKLTILYKQYRSNGEWTYRQQEKKRHPILFITVALMLIVDTLIAVSGTIHFDSIYRSEITAQIIAHRAGGREAPENTVKGIEVACKLGAKGCEIDIQRTLDGYYVVNHDNDFSRVAGVGKKPSEMTLSEVKELRVDGEPVPTLEEMLDASRDKVILFVELKGETADNQMADDAVRIIKEKGMEDQAVLISLKYDVLEYIEQKYPEMQTGYLAFISFGQIENTPFDYLALEEEISTDETIAAIHEKGKMIMVWTVNEEDDIEYFMCSNADAIITDSVKLSGDIKEQLSKRTPLEIIMQETFMSAL